MEQEDMMNQRFRRPGLTVLLFLAAWLMACSRLDTAFRELGTELAPTSDGQTAVTAKAPTVPESPSTPAAERQAAVRAEATMMPGSLPKPAGRSGHIVDLMAEGAITVEARGAGIENLELVMESLLDEPLEVQIPAGTYFVSGSGSVQNMAVRRTEVVYIQPGQSLTGLLDAVCAELEKEIPEEGDTFATVGRPPPALAQLMAVLDQPDLDYDIQQAAVWIVTDNADYEDLGRLERSLLGAPGSRAIDEADVALAMQYVQEAGIDITRQRIWEEWDRFAAYATPGALPMPSRRTGHIVDLVAEAAIAIEATRSGSVVLDLRIENLLDELVYVQIPAGVYFHSERDDDASMVALGSHMTRLKPDERKELSIPAASADLEKRLPGSADPLSAGHAPDQALTQLMATLEQAPYVRTYALQAAVWIVTDDANYRQISGHMVTQAQSGQFDHQDAAQAMRLVDQAGIDITSCAIWQDRAEIAESIKGEEQELARWLLLHQPGGDDAASGAPTETAGKPEPLAGTVSSFPLPGGSAVDMVYVPGGPFLMGSGVGNDDQQPVHEVNLDAFWIDQTEVTNAHFAAFAADTGYLTTMEQAGGGFIFNASGEWEQLQGADWKHPHGPESDLTGMEEHPVVQVSWEDADAYCTWRGVRLPTEAEWEKAARGTDLRSYPWDDAEYTTPREFGEHLNLCDLSCPWNWADQWADDGHSLTAPVGSYPAGVSPYGALDMAGNVSEWTADWYDESYYARSPGDNPAGPPDGEWRVLRGGSFASSKDIELVYRSRNAPWAGGFDVGFRCANTP